MGDLTPGQEPTPEPQAGEGQPTGQEQPKTDLTPEQLRAKLTEANGEAAATRKKLREAEARLAAADKARADAEAASLAEQGKYKELYEKAQAEAQAAAEKLQRMERDQMRRDAAQAAGIPQLWQRLQGETAEALAEDAKGLAAFVTAANGQPAARAATTQPTPAAQGDRGDFVRQAIERQHKRATDNDPYEAMMKR